MLGMIVTAVAVVVAILAFMYLQLGSSSSGTPPLGQNPGVLEKQLDLHNLSHSARIWIIPNFLAPDEVHIVRYIHRNTSNRRDISCRRSNTSWLLLEKQAGATAQRLANRYVFLHRTRVHKILTDLFTVHWLACDDAKFHSSSYHAICMGNGEKFCSLTKWCVRRLELSLCMCASMCEFPSLCEIESV